MWILNPTQVLCRIGSVSQPHHEGHFGQWQSPDQRPMVSPSNIEGNTWASSSAPLSIALAPIPINLQHGTEHTVEQSIAKPFSEGFNNDPHQWTHHELPLLLLTLSLDTPDFPASPNNSTAFQPSRCKLDALECKIRHSLEEDFQHLTYNGDASSCPTLYKTLLQAASNMPPLPPDALEQLKCKICCSLPKDFTHLDEAPADPTTITHHVSDPVLTPDKPATALPSVSSMFPTLPCSMDEMPLPPAKPPDPPPMPFSASNQQPNNLPDSLPYSDITVPSKCRKKPPDCIDW